jgi:hypothetical protein
MLARFACSHQDDGLAGVARRHEGVRVAVGERSLDDLETPLYPLLDGQVQLAREERQAPVPGVELGEVLLFAPPSCVSFEPVPHPFELRLHA